MFVAVCRDYTFRIFFAQFVGDFARHQMIAAVVVDDGQRPGAELFDLSFGNINSFDLFAMKEIVGCIIFFGFFSALIVLQDDLFDLCA